MANVLTQTSTLTCAHQGNVTAMATQSVLKVNGQSVLVTQVQGAIAGCIQVPPPPSNKPCTSVTSQVGGTSTVLKVNGSPVLLDTSSGLTDGSPTNTWSVQTAGQSLLNAV